MASFAKLAAGSRRLAASAIAPKHQIGSISLFSTAAAPAAATKAPSPPGTSFGRCTVPTTILPPSPAPLQRRVTDTGVLRAALRDLQRKQKEEIGGLERMLDTLRIVRLPTKTHTSVEPTTILPSQPQQQHTFQAMNRNARKPKRANHGKRPCSRVRRRFKKRKWQNPSRRG
ncbi:hypothetical protein ACHAXT_008433 [Thalassiosira profunda]